MALLLRESDVLSLLEMHGNIMVLEQAFSAWSQGNAVNLPRTRIVQDNGVMHLLAASVPSLGIVGFKTYTVFRSGMRHAVMLFSTLDGRLLSIIEADFLGRMRTGATSGLATKYLARPDASVVGLIGAGKQAYTQVLGVSVVRQVRVVYVYSRRLPECEKFCEELSRRLSIEVRPAPSARQAIEDADIVISATTSPEPVLPGDWLKSGSHINAIGSNWANRRELDLATLQRSRVIVTDSQEQARAEAGDFVIPANEGLFDWDKVSELADVVAGRGPKRELANDITLYKGVGIAIEDVATATHVYTLARERGVGEEINLLQ
ncbi:MAG TPA: ornithine cyclodeaminase family protein [Ktedonobacteraceae bacterium]|nr:ornithine cyclodeaminase family protein [Ktedonobacteraceae bacterium]